MDTFKNILVSWKTTFIGLAAIATVLAKWANAGAIDPADYSIIIAGIIGIFAKDAGVTGAVK